MHFQRYIIFAILATLLLGACKNYKSEVEALKEDKEEMEEKLNQFSEEDRLIRGEYAEAIDALNAIEDSLGSIASRDSEIKKLSQKMEFTSDVSQRQAILENLNALKEQNEETKNQAQQLRYMLKKYKSKNQLLRKMIDQAENRLGETDEKLVTSQSSISQMEEAVAKMEEEIQVTETDLAGAYEDLKSRNDKLEDANKKLERLIQELKEKRQFIDKQAKGYVVCGDKRYLRQRGIMAKMSQKLTRDYQAEIEAHSSVINYFESGAIDCGGEGEIEMVLPERSASSYTIEGSKLIINDAEAFWSTSNTVILVKK